MFATTTILVALFSVVASVVSAGLVPRRDPPAGWNFAVLEDYQTYHTRYLALGCEFQHGKPLFDECCHPHLNSQTLSDFPAECTPSPAAMSSAALAEPTSTVSTPNDSDDSGVETVTVTSTSSAPGPTSSSDDNGDDEDEDCDPEDEGDDDDEPTSSTTPAAAPAPSPSPEEPKSSSTPAPAPSSTPEPSKSTPAPSPAPAAAETPKPSSSSSEAPAPSSSPSSGGDSGDITGGVATFFFQGGNAGACGTVHQDSDFVAAIDSARYNGGALCGKQVQITNSNNGNSVTVTIADECPTCNNGNSIDLSVGAFTQLATEEEGEVPIKWHFL